MSIFGTILGKIFGKGSTDATAATTPDTAPVATSDAPATPVAIPDNAASVPTPTLLSGIDVAAVMDRYVAESGQRLDWRVSIVDLMKALGMDSSLEHRKQLAGELGYGGDTNDSASMNIWLHKQVLSAIAANGGALPANLTG